MAIKRWWVKDAAASGSSHGSLTEVAPTNNSGSITGTGWTVDTLSSTTLYSLLQYGSKRASSTFTSGAKPASAPSTNDCWRTTDGFGTGKYSGTFAAGTWTVGAMLTSAVGSGANVKLEIRIWRSANADGSSATEITSGAVETSAAVAVDSGNNAVSATFNPGAITLTNEYLFFQVACRINGAGGVAGSDAALSLWPLVNTNTGIANITTPNFADAAATSVPTFQAAGTAVNGLSTLTPAWPTHVSGDIALLFVESANEAITLSSAQGFVEITNSPQGTGTGAGTTATRLAVFWCRATSSAMTAPTVADSGDHTDAIIVTFRNCIASGTPYEVSAGDTAAASATVTVPGATTTVNNQLVVLAAANPVDSASDQSYKNWVNSHLANIMEVAGENTTQGNGGGINIATGELVTAGAYGTTTCTRLTSTVQARISLSLLPASSGVNGTLSSTLAACTASATGTVAVAATASPTLAACTVAATGTVAVAATASPTLAACTSSATGAVAVAATLAATLANCTSTATGTGETRATLAATLAACTASGAGTVAVAATLSATLDALTAVATGTVADTATAADTLAACTLTATGTVAIAATASITLASLAASATGAAADAASASATLAALTLTATGAVAIAAELAAELGDLVVDASGVSESGTITTGQLAVTLDACALAAAAAVAVAAHGSATLDALTCSGVGHVAVSAAAAATLASSTCAAAGAVAVTAAAALTLGALTSTGVAGESVSAALDVTLEALTCQASARAVTGFTTIYAAEALESRETIAIALELVDAHSIGAAEAITSTRTIAAALELVDAETVDATEEPISSTRISIQLEVLP